MHSTDQRAALPQARNASSLQPPDAPVGRTTASESNAAATR
ncbi:MAG TPA: hypothetical protein VFJ87_04100 [Rhodanobacteraceae bacterium]|nr:hypothetical protein [Rhodanobacteraceae bacterium]